MQSNVMDSRGLRPVRRHAARLAVAGAVALSLGPWAVPAARAANCHAAKNCGSPPPPVDSCDNGGVRGASQVDQIVDRNPGAKLGGIAHDPGVGGFGLISSPVYEATRGTPAASAGIEVACALNAINPIVL